MGGRLHNFIPSEYTLIAMVLILIPLRTPTSTTPPPVHEEGGDGDGQVCRCTGWYAFFYDKLQSSTVKLANVLFYS